MIDIKNLTAGYNQKVVVSRLSFSLVQADSPLIIVGKNGCGKSTLLKALLGFLPYSGSIILASSDLHRAWLPQNYSIGLPLPVLDFVALGRTNLNTMFPSQGKESKKSAWEALEKLNLTHLAYKQTDEISTGEWQLAAVAQLFVENADVWILDEPTSSLDVYYKNLVFQHLWEAARLDGKTVVLSTHDIPFIPQTSGTFLLLDRHFSYPLFPNTPENRSDIMNKLLAAPMPDATA